MNESPNPGGASRPATELSSEKRELLELLLAEREPARDEPRTPAERTLAGIVAQVLGLEAVGTNENFFELGGDSIHAIQVVARARRAGLNLTTHHLFDHPTVAEACRRLPAGAVEPVVPAVPPGTPVPLSPAQRWFAELDPADPHHWNLGVLLEVASDVSADWLETALRAVAARHETLGYRFRRTAEGWTQETGESAEIRFDRFEVGGCDDRRAAIREIAARVHGSLDPASGRVAAAAFIDMGEGANRLLLVVHHLACDGVSFRILLDDAQTAVEQLRGGDGVSLPPAPPPFRLWTERSAAGWTEAESRFWRSYLAGVSGELPRDRNAGPNTVGSSRFTRISLDAEATGRLLRAGEAGRVEEHLLAALGVALRPWTGDGPVLVALERHGRASTELDASRTVGWFTSLVPFRLEPGDGDFETTLDRVRRGLASLPNQGLGYASARYLLGDPDLPRPACDLTFNYLGRFDTVLESGGPFRRAAEEHGPFFSPNGRRACAIEVVADINDGCLSATFIHSDNLHDPKTVAALADRFRAALDRVPAFPRSGLDRADLAIVRGRYADSSAPIADVHPLTPTQEGLLFHVLADPTCYHEQGWCDLRGTIDPNAFARAWDALVARHAALRSAFVWEGIAHPVQVVFQRGRLPIEFLDGRTETDPEARFEALLAADRARGFDLGVAPLARGVLVRTGEDGHRFLLSSHHLIGDLWSTRRLLDEFLTLYADPAAVLPPAPDFGDYAMWLRDRRDEDGPEYWRDRLAGFVPPPPLPVSSDGGGFGHLSRTAALPVATGVTDAALFLGAWALVLAEAQGRRDVVFGGVTSGRPPDMPGVEAVVGPFIVTLPVRVRIPPDETVAAWLNAIHLDQARSRRYETVPLSRIAASFAGPLFDTIVVIQNIPLARAAGALAVSNIRAAGHPNYPVTLRITPPETVELLFDRRRLTEETAARLVDRFLSLAAALAASPTVPVAALLTGTTVRPRREGFGKELGGLVGRADDGGQGGRA